MTFTLMLTATTVLTRSLSLLRRIWLGGAAASHGGGFPPAVVDYHRSRVPASIVIVGKCLICQRRQWSYQKACRLLYHRASA